MQFKLNRSLAEQLFDRLVPIIIGLVILPVIGIVGYHWIEGWSWMDGLYMTVTTLSTVGFGEVHPLSRAGQLFTMGLIVSGGALAAYSVGQLGQFFFSGEWRRHWENQSKLRMLEKLSNHVIVCGFGRMGSNVARELQVEGLPFVVIDSNPSKIAEVKNAGFLGILGDAAHDTHLRTAGIERARGLVAAAKTDAENVFIVLTARSLRPDIAIVSRAEVDESEAKLRRAGANRVIMPYHTTGRRMVTMLVRPDVADFLDEVSHTGGLELMLEQARVSPGSPLVGQTLGEARLKHGLDITVLACKRPDGHWNMQPGEDTTIQANAQVIALGTLEKLKVLIRLASPGSGG